MPILGNPDYHAIIYTHVLSLNTRRNLMNVNKIIKKLSRANLFDATLETNFTKFNTYILEVYPHLNNFFDQITKIKIPMSIERSIDFINNKEYNEKDIKENYFECNKNHLVNMQTICFSIKDLLLFYKIVTMKLEKFSRNENLLKALDKIYYHEKSLTSRIDDRKYFLLFDITYNPEQTTLLFSNTLNKFTFNKIAENEEDDNPSFIISRVKYCLKLILRGLNIISPRIYPHLEESETSEQIINGLLSIVKNEEYYSNELDDKVPLSWYSLYLISNLERLNLKYKLNDYNLLYSEILEDARHEIANANEKSYLITTKLGVYIRSAEKINEITRKDLYKVTQADKNLRLENFFNNLTLKACVKKEVSKDGYVSILIFKAEDCAHKRFNLIGRLIEAKIDKTLKGETSWHIEKIQGFIQILEESQELKKDIETGLTETEISTSIKNYLFLIKDELYRNLLFTKFIPSKCEELLEEIETIIFRKSYKMLFPSLQSLNDDLFFKKCIEYQFIKPEHLEINKKYLNEALWENACLFLKAMDSEKSPIDKLRCVQNAYKILNNCINFCSGKNENAGVDDIIPIFIFIIIKSQPKRMFSNINYIKAVTDPGKLLATYGFLLSQVEMATEFILNLNKENLKITEK